MLNLNNVQFSGTMYMIIIPTMTTTPYFVIHKFRENTEPTFTVLARHYNLEYPILDRQIICLNYDILSQST